MKAGLSFVSAAAALLWCVSTSLWAASTDVYEAEVQRIIEGFDAHSADAFNHALDADRIVDTALKGMLVEPDWEKLFRKKLPGALHRQVGAKMLSQIPEGAYAKLLRMKADGNVRLALIRFDYGFQGNGYVELHLSREKGGAVRIVDWFDYSTGQRHS